MLAKTKKEKIEEIPHYKFHRKHKILFGGFSSLVIVFIILSSVALYTIYIKLDANYDSLQIKIEEMQQNTNNKLDEVTNNLILTQSEVDLAIQRLSSTEERISSLGTEFDELKASASADFSNVIERAVPAVVTIRTNVAQGTGFIIDDRGYIVTNAHVLSGATSVNAITFDKKNIQTELAESPRGRLACFLLNIAYNYRGSFSGKFFGNNLADSLSRASNQSNFSF